MFRLPPRAALFRFSAPLLLALSTAAQPAPPAAAPRDPARLATEFCAGCHGPNLTGGTAPNLLDDVWKHGADDASILRAIANGFPQLGMVPYTGLLTEKEQSDLVAYLRRRARQYALGLVPLNVPPPDVAVFDTQHGRIRLETVASPLNTPWSIVFLPDGRLLVSDRIGHLRTIEHGRLLPDPIRDTPKPFVKQDGGFLDLIAHPDYARNGWLFLAYTELGEDTRTSNTVVVRGRIRDGAWTDESVLFRAPQKYYYTDTSHYGCGFLFDPDGHLLFTVGDRGNAAEAQDLSSPLGKIHRMTIDGAPAPGNPFLGQPGVWPTIWTYGNRHAQGLRYHPVTGKLWATEHGPRGGDELNLILPGRNYGWPVISDGLAQRNEKIEGTARAGMERPVISWTPSIAPAAIEFSTSPRFPRWENHLLLASLVGRHLRRLELDGDKVVHEEVLFAEQGRVRDIATGPDGYLYVALNNPGRIARIVPVE